MAIVTTSTAKTVQLVFSADADVTIRPEAEEKRKAAQADTSLRNIADEERAAARERLMAGPLSPCFVTADECKLRKGATVFRVRALSWPEYQEAESLAPEAQILRQIEIGLIDIDGSTEAAEAFKREPNASLVVPLYRAIVDLTWGN